MTLDEIVALVVADQRAAGEVVRAPASPDAVAEVRAALAVEFGATLPEAYAALLSRSDGLEHDGLVLYGVGAGAGAAPALLEMNRIWREAPGRDEVLVLGDSDMDLVVVALDGTTPCLLDKVGGDVVVSFPDVATALIELLTGRL